MKKILVPTDFSEQAQNAIRIASVIAHKSGGEIHLLHVIDASWAGGMGPLGVNTMGEPTNTSMDQLFVLKLMETNKKQLIDIAQTLHDQGISVVHNIEVGNIFSAVNLYIQDYQIDLVVMGTKGSSGFSEFLVGSNTEKVVRHSSCPVLSVRNLEIDFAIEDIVFASNFEDDQMLAVSQLKRFQELFGANLHMVYINVPNNFSNTRSIRKRMEAYVQRYQLSNYKFSIYNDSSEEEGIIHFAEEVNADIIAVATHGRTGLSHLLSGSIAEDIVNHANRPVLTFNLRKAVV